MKDGMQTVLSHGAELDGEACYRALRARDARYDGRFFTAVTTTRIYCRPVCPARTPRRTSCRFYPTAAAAQADGFRPCLRCRPETSPGTPAWLGTSSTVARALRLIRDGALSADGVDDLGERVGVGARHLRRLFLRHVGATPIAVAQTQRTLFAKQLLDETDLPMTEIALAAGFASVRRFNTAMREIYHRPPSELRRGRAKRPNPNGDRPGLRIALAYRPPYDWSAIAAYLGARGTPGVEAAKSTSYRRTLRLGDRAAWIEVAPVPGQHRLVVHLHTDAPADSLLRFVGRVRQLFDLDADPAAITSHLENDARLAPVVAARPGLRVAGAWDGFELAVRAILGQQVSVRAATTLIGRVAAEFGDPLPASLQPPPELQRLFPLPRALARAPLERCGITRARAEAIRTLAAAVAGGEILLDGSRAGEADALVQLPGIGPWTASYIALRALREPDAFPESDLGLRRAFAVLQRASRPVSAGALLRAAEAWRPWRGYAALHLWTWESNDVTHAV